MDTPYILSAKTAFARKALADHIDANDVWPPDYLTNQTQGLAYKGSAADGTLYFPTRELRDWALKLVPDSIAQGFELRTLN